jgi:hypothetical protein
MRDARGLDAREYDCMTVLLLLLLLLVVVVLITCA